MTSRIDRQVCKDLRAAIAEALASVEAEFGVAISLGNATFTRERVTFKVEAATVDENGDANTKEAADFKLHALEYGLQPHDLGRSFDSLGTTFTIVGLKPRSKKYPILARSAKDGKVYKFSRWSIPTRTLHGD